MALRDIFRSAVGRRAENAAQTTEIPTGPPTDPRSELPALAFPPIWPVVRSAGEARANYSDWELVIGEAASGPVTVNLWRSGHILCVGASGSGRSVLARSWLEQFRAAGWQVIIGDGIGTDHISYSLAHGDGPLPPAGVVAVGRGGGTWRGMEYVGGIVLAHQLLKERQNAGAAAKLRDPANWDNFAPAVLVLDELRALRQCWKSALPASESAAIESMMTEILALGRALRVHVVLAATDARDTTIPNTWKSNVATTVCMGRPAELTLRYAIDQQSQAEVRRIAEAMDPRVRGRGIVATLNEETGAAEVTEFQGYLSYAPGEPVDGPHSAPAAKGHWVEFKEKVSDAVPRMYTRQWFRVVAKSEAQLAAEAKSGEDMGYIDFDMFTVEEIAKMDRVGLDMRHPDGRITPNPKVSKFDPLSVDYVCRPPDPEPGAGFSSIREEL